MSPDAQPSDVRMVTDRRRFELDCGGDTAFVDYMSTAEGDLALNYAEVPVALRGGGLGGVLIEGTLDLCEARGLQVLPFCPYIHTWIRRHPERVDQVSDRYVRKDALTR